MRPINVILSKNIEYNYGIVLDEVRNVSIHEFLPMAVSFDM